MLNFGRYVLVSKRSNCSAIVHRESRGGEFFTFIRKILPNIESSVDDTLPASKEG